jgi:hypothetical protein
MAAPGNNPEFLRTAGVCEQLVGFGHLLKVIAFSAD